MEPFKIAHLITGLSRAGAETVLVRLVLHMDPKRFTPVVISLTDDHGYGADLRVAGVPLYTLGMKRGRPSLGALLRLRKILRQEKPSLLQTWLYHADFAGTLATLFTSLPLVWNLRCSEMDMTQYSFQVQTIRGLLAWLSHRPAAVIVNSETGRLYHERLGYRPRRWEEVPNGFDTDLFRPSFEKRAQWRKRLGIEEGTKLIGMVARVDPMKDHATFLAAAERIGAARKDAAFVLVGAGTESLALPGTMAGRIQALGERNDLQDILPALDLLMLSSAFGEGFPNVLGEAMSCAVPAVATSVGDAPTIISGTGSVVPPRDPVALANAAIAFLARDGVARANQGEAARRRILENYRMSTMVERYERIYGAIAEGPTARARQMFQR